MHPMKTERKTPRTDAQTIPEVYDDEGSQPCPEWVDRDFARALEIETQELAEALEATYAAITDSDNSRGDNSWEAERILNAALARHRANQEVKP